MASSLTHTQSTPILETTVTLLEDLRAKTPLVQCITNIVVPNFTANALLAIGAAPAMVDIPEEAGRFARIASGVLLNVGTPHAEQREAMLEAAHAANEAGTPWVLDPVAVGSLPVRTGLARQLQELNPTVIRGNASEIIGLTGSGAGGRGVESTDEVDAASQTAIELAQSIGGVVAVSGPVDFITDGETHYRVRNGTPLLTQVTGGGCALGAVIAAFASLGEDRLATTTAAVIVYTVAADIAAELASGPGSFAVAFLDALTSVNEDDLRERAKIA